MNLVFLIDLKRRVVLQDDSLNLLTVVPEALILRPMVLSYLLEHGDKISVGLDGELRHFHCYLLWRVVLVS